LSALTEHIEALRRDPTSADAAAAVREHALANGAFDSYAQAFAERGTKLAELDRSKAVESLVEAAQIYEEDLNDLERAAALYQEVVGLEPTHRRSLFALGLLLHDLSRFDELIALYEARLERSQDDGEKTTLNLYIAELFSEQLGDANLAFEAVMRAARLSPQNLRIISRLERLGESTDRLDEVAVVIGDLLINQDDPRVRAALSLRLAELQIGPLDAPERALACFRSALVDDGANPEILANLKDVFQERERFDELAVLLEDVSRDRRVGPQRIRLERELAVLYERELGDTTRALAAIARAANASPDDRDILDEVMRLGLVADDMSTVADVFEQVVEQTTNALLRTYALLKLGHLYSNALDRPADAIAVYERILGGDANHAEARRRLRGLYERTGDLDKLIASLEDDAAHLEDPDERRAIEEEISAKRADLNALRRIPEDRRDGLDANEDVTTGSQESLEEALESLPVSAVSRSDGEEATETETDLAALIAPEPDEAEARAPTIKPLETLDGEYSAPALSADGLIADEVSTPALNADGLVADEASAPSPDTGDLVDRPLTEHDDSSDLVEPAQDAEALIAAVAEGMEAEESEPALDAEDLVAESISATSEFDAGALVAGALEPSDDVDNPDEVATTPGAMEVRRGAPDDVDEGLAAEESAPALSADGLVADSAPELSLVRGAPADDEDAENARSLADTTPRAVDTERALAEAEVSPSLQRQAAQTEDRLVELQQGLQDARRAGDRDLQIERLTEIIELTDSVSSYERAFVAAVKLVRLEVTPARVQSLLRLGSLAGTHRELVDTFDEVLSKLDADAQVSFGLSVAEIEAEDLLDPDAASLRLEALHDSTPDRLDVFERWTELLEVEGEHDALVTVLAAEARRVTAPDRARALYLQAARMSDAQLDDPAGAAEILLSYLERAPDDAEIHDEAVRLLERAERWAEVTQLLEAELYRHDVPERVVLRRRIAAVQAHCLDDIDAAEQMLRRGLAEAPDDKDTLLEVCSIYERQARWTDLVDVLTDQVPLAKGPKPRGELRRRIASIATEHLDQPDLAERQLEEAAKDDPGDLAAIEALVALRTNIEDWAAVSDALVLKSHALGEAEARADALVEAAEIRSSRLADPSGAARLYRDALAIAPDHGTALDAYAALAEEEGDYSTAIDALRDLATELDREAAAQVHARVGRILEVHLGQHEDAAFEYQLAVDADPECIDALERLRYHHEERGDPAHALELCARQAGLTEDPRRRAMLWGIAAELATNRVGDNQRAIECYDEALDADPDDLATEAILGELLAHEGQHERAHTHLLRAAKGLSASDRLRATQLMIGAGASAEALDLNLEARTAYESALELAPKERLPLERLADLFEEAGLHERSHEISAALILNHEPDLEPVQLARIYLKMTRAKRQLGETAVARRLVTKARDLAPEDPAVLEAARDVLAESDEIADAATAASELVAQLPEEPAAPLAEALSRAAELHRASDDDTTALPLLVRLADLDRRDVDVAIRLAECRRALNDAPGAANGLADTARRLEGRPRADLLAAAASMLPADPRSRDQAKAFLTEAIEMSPSHRTASDELAIMLEYDGEWAALAGLRERAAVAFLDDPFSLQDANERPRERVASELFDEAFELYRFQIGDAEGALRVARRRVELAPDDFAPQTDLARSLDAAAESPGVDAAPLITEAEAVWSQLADVRPGSLEALRRLHALRVELGANGRARIAAELLVALDAADDDVRRTAGVLEVDRTDEMAAPVKAPKVRGFEVGKHDSEQGTLWEVLATLGSAPLIAFSDVIEQPKLKKRDRVEIGSVGTHLGQALDAAATILGVEIPPIYASEHVRVPVGPGFVDRAPALLVSPTLAGAETSANLRFFAGSALAHLRQGALPLALLPLDVFRTGLEGLAGERIGADLKFAEVKPAKKRGRALEKAIPSVERESSAEAVAQWLGGALRESLAEQRQASLRTAERWGLVASGSLLAAIEVLARTGRRDRLWFSPLVTYAASSAFIDVVQS